MASVSSFESSSRIEIVKTELHHELFLSVEVITTSAGVFYSPWFTNSELMNAEGLVFRIVAIPKACVTCSKAKHKDCRAFYLETRTTSEKEICEDNSEDRPVDTTASTNSSGKVLSVAFLSSDLILKKDPQSYRWSWRSEGRVQTMELYMYSGSSCLINKLTGEIKIDIDVVVARSVLKSSCVLANSPLISSVDCRSRAWKILQEMQSGEICPDVRLALQDGTFSAHRAVLAASSAVFKAMFQHALVEKTEGEVKIMDVRAEVMRAALEFLYGGDVPSDNPLLCMDLLALADRYQLLALKDSCECVLASDTSLDALELLLFAETHQARKLRSVMVQRIAGNPKRKEMIDTDVLKRLSKFYPQILAELLQAVL